MARAREMRKNPMIAERKLWGYLRNFPVKFWRQKPINNFIVDFYCPKLKLVIDVGGDSLFTDSDFIYDGEGTEGLWERISFKQDCNRISGACSISWRSCSFRVMVLLYGQNTICR